MEKKETMCYHSLIDLYNVKFDLLNELDLLLPVLKNIAKIVNLNILDISYHKFNPQGLTVMLLLSESHISIHTWPEKNMACLDILSCKNNPIDYLDEIIKMFDTTIFKHKNIIR
jgi:S-adenosylmethionine decarboxylase